MKKITAILLSLAICFTFIPFMDMSYGAESDAPVNVTIRPDIYGLNGLVVSETVPESLATTPMMSYQIDWRLVGPGVTDTWKYNSYWESCQNGGYDARAYYNEGGPGDDHYIMGFDVGDNSTWTDYFSHSIPEEALIEVEFNGEKVKTLNYDEYAIEVRTRCIHALDWDNNIWQSHDWSEVVTYGYFAKDYEGLDNLLVNPDFEDDLTGWVNPDDTWSVDITTNRDIKYAPRHGTFLAWASSSANLEDDETYIYQDVSLAGHNPDETVVFNTWVCNYDKSPYNMGTIKLVFMDAEGKEIKTYKQIERNPLWTSHSITASIPEGAAAARVYLMGHRYVGKPINVYYDYCSFVIKSDKIYPVKITEADGKEKAVAGDVLQLTANSNGEKDPSKFVWTSSYDIAATVDTAGKVTMNTDAEDGVAIYAKNIDSGVTGVYWINSDEANEPLPMVDTVEVGDENYTYDGEAKTPEVTVKDKSGNVLVAGVDYDVAYPEDCINAGAKTITITGKGEYSGNATATYFITPAAPKSVKLSTTKYTYSGKVKTPTVTAYGVDGAQLVKDRDYTVTYATGRKIAGKYKVTVKFQGNYAGTKTLYFTINPATPSVKSMTVGTKSLKVTMTGKPSAKGATTYQIAYRVKGTSAWKTTTTTASYKTIKSLKKGKVYQVRVRAYKTVNKVKYYSNWTAIKVSKKIK